MSSQPADPSTPSAYKPDPAVEALTPKQPETLTSGTIQITPTVKATQTAILPSMSITPPGIGGLIIPNDTIMETQSPDGQFTTVTAPRPESRNLFAPDNQAQIDSKLLTEFVTDPDLKKLRDDIDTLQQEVIDNVRADRTSTDVYQQDLLYASSLMLQSPAKYEEAKEIMLRVKADLRREQRVQRDIARYRPRLLTYYAFFFLGTFLATKLDPAFQSLIPDNLSVLKLAFPPILFGVLGALFNGTMSLQKHTAVQRDFDPIHVSWYVINPLLGGLMGLIVFVFFVVTGSSLNPNLVVNPSMTTTAATGQVLQQSPLIIWLLAFIAGWQQNIVAQLLNRFVANTVPASKETAMNNRPSASAQNLAQPASKTPPSDGAVG